MEALESRLLLVVVNNPTAEHVDGQFNLPEAVAQINEGEGDGSLVFMTGASALQEGASGGTVDTPVTVTGSVTGLGRLVLAAGSQVGNFQLTRGTLSVGAGGRVTESHFTDARLELEAGAWIGGDPQDPKVIFDNSSLVLGPGATADGVKVTGDDGAVYLDSAAKLLNSKVYGSVMVGGWGSTVSNAVVQGNTIHCTSAYRYHALNIHGDHTIVGGTEQGQSNIIAGVPDGVAIALSDGSNDTQIVGNFIGTTDWGMTSAGDAVGIGNSEYMGGGSSNLLIKGNVISGNTNVGILLNVGTGHRVLGNVVGLNANGTALPNGVGISVNADAQATIGGSLSTEANVISANRRYGILLESSGSFVLGNLIGTDRTGTVALGNEWDGLLVSGNGNTIGAPQAGNVVAANKWDGMAISGDENKIQSNYIGTNSAEYDLGNGVNGVSIIGNDNIVGCPVGTDDTTLGNWIAFNGDEQNGGASGDGVVVGGEAVHNCIRLNRIFKNNGLGIDLGNDYFDRYDPTAAGSGPNEHQWHPTIVRVDKDTGTIEWMLNAPADRTYTIDVYADPKNGRAEYAEGQEWKESLAPAFQHGHWEFTTHVGVSKITATATDDQGNTSEFSLADEDADGLCDTWEANGYIDLHGDGTHDVNLDQAHLLQQDLYIQYDSMAGWGPLAGALEMVQAKFARKGITLHIDRGPNQNIASANFGLDPWTPFHAIKAANFVGNGNGPGTDAYEAKLLAYRYCVFGVSFGGQDDNRVWHPVLDSSGLSEILGNDFMVTLSTIWSGETPTQNNAAPTAAQLAASSMAMANTVLLDQAGTFMHEFGHTLGLTHSGPSNWDGTTPRDGCAAVTERDASYQSVMNYRFQGPGIGFWLNPSLPLSDPPNHFVSDPQRLDYLDTSPNEWKNLWFAFQEDRESSTGGDAGSAPTDVEPSRPELDSSVNDLVASVIPLPDTPSALGTEVSVVFSVVNLGLASATGATFTLVVPDGLSIGSVVVSRGSVLVSGSTITASFGDLANLEGATLTATVAPTQVGTFVLSGTAESTNTDGMLADNIASATLVTEARPTSAVTPLPTISSASFTVSWSGSDAASYDIFVSDNGGPFGLWLDNTTQVAATFTGQLGHRYGFYSVARNPAGVEEPPPAVADTETLVSAQPCDAIGVYVPGNSAFYLHDRQDGGDAEHVFVYGVANVGWMEMVGDWNGDGQDTPGFYDPATATFYLTDRLEGGDATHVFNFGIAGLGWKPLVGDWDADGKDSIAIYEPATSLFFFKNTLAGGDADEAVQFGVGSLGWIPIAGDWDGIASNGDGFGFYEPAISAFWLKNARTSGPAEECFQFGMGSLGWTVLAGNWDGLPGDGVGFYVPETAQFFLKNAHTPGPADTTFTYGIGGAGWRPLVGCWQASTAAAPAAAPGAALECGDWSSLSTAVEDQSGDKSPHSIDSPVVDQLDMAALAAQQFQPAISDADLDLLFQGRRRRW